MSKFLEANQAWAAACSAMIMDWLWQGRGLSIPTDEMFTETEGLSVDITTVLKDVWESRPDGPNTELYPALKH